MTATAAQIAFIEKLRADRAAHPIAAPSQELIDGEIKSIAARMVQHGGELHAEYAATRDMEKPERLAARKAIRALAAERATERKRTDDAEAAARFNRAMTVDLGTLTQADASAIIDTLKW